MKHFKDFGTMYSPFIPSYATIKIITDEVLQYPDTEYVAREIVLKILTRRCISQYGKPLSKNDFDIVGFDTFNSSLNSTLDT